MGRWSAVDWEVERGGGERVGRRAAATTSSASSTVINFMVAVFILEGEQAATMSAMNGERTIRAHGT